MAERTDRELLELAAKAVGLWDWRERCIDIPWNPLADDGDALRLAVKLRINVYNAPERGSSASFWLQEIDHVIYCNEKDSDTAATRRAIVRAAAEIGAKE